MTDTGDSYHELPIQLNITRNLDHGEALSDIRKVSTDSTVASPDGGQSYCSEQPAWDTSLSNHDLTKMDEMLQPIEQQLHYLLNTADEFTANLLYRNGRLQKDGFVQSVPTFLRTCQPYFTYLESMARSFLPQCTPLPLYIRTRLLQFSQQLCSRLEQLVLMYASFNFLSLEEADPSSISPLYIGQFQIDRIRVSIFYYCQPSRFLAGVNSGSLGRLYKRMRWNVERQRDGEGEADGRTEEEMGTETEYYFLCYERLTERSCDRGNEKRMESGDSAVSLWSVGQWVQTDPDPKEEDISDWVLCLAPQGQYRLLFHLGTEEPSVRTATDCLIGALFSQGGSWEHYGVLVNKAHVPTTS